MICPSILCYTVSLVTWVEVLLKKHFNFYFYVFQKFPGILLTSFPPIGFDYKAIILKLCVLIGATKQERVGGVN